MFPACYGGADGTRTRPLNGTALPYHRNHGETPYKYLANCLHGLNFFDNCAAPAEADSLSAAHRSYDVSDPVRDGGPLKVAKLS